MNDINNFVIKIDGSKVITRKDFFDIINLSLMKLIDEFLTTKLVCDNLDSLFDLLSVSEQNVNFVIHNEDILISNLGNYYFAIKRMLSDLSDYNPNICFRIM